MNSTASQTKPCSEPIYAAFDAAWGWVAVKASRRGLTRLILPQPTKHEALGLLDVHDERLDVDAFAAVAHQVQRYFEGKVVTFTAAIDLGGLPPFTTVALSAARHIPYGSAVTYGELAAQLGKPQAARAVGQAMARNPVPLIVPCHRVVGASGLCGFSAEGGLDLKRRLLELEGRQ